MTGSISENDSVPASGIKKIIINKKEVKTNDYKSLIPALSNHDILIRKSGYIFNSSIIGSSLYIGILPYFIEGQRTYHYQIELPERGKCVLFGFINPNGSLALLFKPEKDTYNGSFLPGIADIFRDNYVRLARFLIKCGLPGDYGFEVGTSKLLEEINLFAPSPATVRELASQPAPYDSTLYASEDKET